MKTLHFIDAMPLSKKASTHTLDALVRCAEEINLDNHQTVFSQKAPARYFYLLIEGGVEFLIDLTRDGEQLSAGASAHPYTPIGWAGFRAPYRYQITARCFRDSKFLRWEQSALAEIFQNDAEFALAFHAELLRHSESLLLKTRDEYVRSTQEQPYAALAPERLEQSAAADQAVSEIIESALFFEAFGHEFKRRVAAIGELYEFAPSANVLNQSEAADGLWVLLSGHVSLWVEHQGQKVFFRHLEQPGQVVGWSDIQHNNTHAFSATADSHSRLWFVKKSALKSLLVYDVDDALLFYNRLLWLTGNHLRSLRTRTLSNRAESEAYMVSGLIEQCHASLSTRSAIHKIPALLEHQITVDDAFSVLNELTHSQQKMERSLAGLVLDVLAPLKTESNFIDKLTQIYDHVVEAPEHVGSTELRNTCANMFVDAFESVPHVLSGLEHLPEKSGNIFILNHLICHPYYQLPNGFEFALDSHFVSAMVVNKKYNKGGLRVVRKSRGVEFGHQLYYDRLEHIYVYTRESDEFSADKTISAMRRGEFFGKATDALQSGDNIIICPEGTSRPFEQSPGIFKPGAFMLSNMSNQEALIVPVAVANFQRRVKDSVWSVVVKPPIKLSEHVDVTDRVALLDYLAGFQKVYRTYVEEAADLAASYVQN